MADGKRYYWLKLHDDFFDSKRIKKLRRMAGGDTYTIIYLKMQLMAMKKDGILTYTGLEDSVADELALDLDESPDDVRVTLAYLLSCGLAETDDQVNFLLPYAISNTGSETASAQRWRDWSERQKALVSNTPLTECKQFTNGEKEKEKEKEKEIDTRDREKIYSSFPELNDAIISFVEFRKKIKKPMTDRAIALLLGKLTAMCGDDAKEKVEVINQSILNGWSGVFPLREVKENKEERVF